MTAAKHVAIVKDTGLGFTEYYFVLRWIAWMCLRNEDLKGQYFCIIIDPNTMISPTFVHYIMTSKDHPSQTEYTCSTCHSTPI
jgi:hypothetical protein